jgi:molybdate transport system permease protein
LNRLFPGKKLPQSTSRPRLRGLMQVLSLPMLLFLILPLAALFLRVSPSELISNLTRGQVLQALGLSLSTTLSSTILILVFGTPLAFALARRCFRYQRLVDTLVDLPIVMPPAVAGIALLMAFGRRGLLGGAMEIAGIRIAFTPLAVIMAQVFIAAPFYIKSAAVGFANIDTEIEQAAGLDGAGRWQMFRHVIVPLSWTALLSGSVLAWARALGEFGATIIFAGNFPGRTQTMPLAIYIGFELDFSVALTLSVILISLSFLSLLVVRLLLEITPEET